MVGYLWRSQLVCGRVWIGTSVCLAWTHVNHRHGLTVDPLLPHNGPFYFPAPQPILGVVLRRQLTHIKNLGFECNWICLHLPHIVRCRGSSQTQVWPLETGNSLGWNSYFDVLGKKINRAKCSVPGWYTTDHGISIFLSPISSGLGETFPTSLWFSTESLSANTYPTFHQQQNNWGKKLKENM